MIRNQFHGWSCVPQFFILFHPFSIFIYTYICIYIYIYFSKIISCFLLSAADRSCFLLRSSPQVWKRGCAVQAAGPHSSRNGTRWRRWTDERCQPDEGNQEMRDCHQRQHPSCLSTPESSVFSSFSQIFAVLQSHDQCFSVMRELPTRHSGIPEDRQVMARAGDMFHGSELRGACATVKRNRLKRNDAWLLAFAALVCNPPHVMSLTLAVGFQHNER